MELKQIRSWEIYQNLNKKHKKSFFVKTYSDNWYYVKACKLEPEGDNVYIAVGINDWLPYDHSYERDTIIKNAFDDGSEVFTCKKQEAAKVCDKLKDVPTLDKKIAIKKKTKQKVMLISNPLDASWYTEMAKIKTDRARSAQTLEQLWLN